MTLSDAEVWQTQPPMQTQKKTAKVSATFVAVMRAYLPRTQLYVLSTEKGIPQDKDSSDSQGEVADAHVAGSELDEIQEINELEERDFDDEDGVNFNAGVEK